MAWGRIAEALTSSAGAEDWQLAADIRKFVRRQPAVQEVQKQRQREAAPRDRPGPEIQR